MTIKLIGALTSKPYAFTARSWELKNVETIDLLDSSCSNIKVSVRGSEIMRILPINNEFINEEWISDKTRFAYDGLKRWRFIAPLVKKNNSFIQVSWKEALQEVATRLKKDKFKNIILNTGNFTDLETLATLKTWSNNYNNIIINSQNYINCDKENFCFNLNSSNNVEENTVYILSGINLRFQNPVLNIKMRKLSLQDNIIIGYIGSNYNNNLNCFHLGNNFAALINILRGKHPFLSLINRFLKNRVNSKLYFNPIQLLLGEEFIQKQNANNLLSFLDYSKNNKYLNFNFSYISAYSGQINAKELNLTNNNNHLLNKKEKNFYYLIGSEKFKKLNNNDFVVFQGHHNDLSRTNFDIILPSYNWTEKTALYMNYQKIVQKSNIVCTPPTQSRLDWKIVRMLSIMLDEDIQFESVKDIHSKLNRFSPNLLNSINKYDFKHLFNLQYVSANRNKLTIIKDKTPFKSLIPDFYNSTSLERSSKIMNECSKNLSTQNNNFLK